MKKFLFNHVLPYPLFFAIHLLCLTLRKHNKNPEGENYFLNLPGPYILTLWHGRIFYLFHHYRNRPDLHLLVSPSEDGDLLANVARLFGYSVIRGSTYKSPVAATRALLRVLKRGERIIVVADGSRGPCCKAQPGTLLIARSAGVPLIPMTYDAGRKIQLNSWDRHVIPLPFTRCVLNYGAPMRVDRDAGETAIQNQTRALEAELQRITEECFS